MILTRYCVFADGDRRHAHLVAAASDAEAALVFVETWRPEPDDDSLVRVIVTEEESGRQACFEIDLEAGAAEPCADPSG